MKTGKNQLLVQTKQPHKLTLACALTSIDHNAHHGLSVADGAAPQQEVAIVEANTNPTGVLPVVQHARTNYDITSELMTDHSCVGSL